MNSLAECRIEDSRASYRYQLVVLSPYRLIDKILKDKSLILALETFL